MGSSRCPSLVLVIPISFMRLSRHPHWSRIVVLLALFQMVAPSVAAVADAWRVDGRVAYDHMESESSAACVVVHRHDCVLCPVATGPVGAVPPSPVPVCGNTQGLAGRIVLMVSWREALLPNRAPRAPPTVSSFES